MRKKRRNPETDAGETLTTGRVATLIWVFLGIMFALAILKRTFK